METAADRGEMGNGCLRIFDLPQVGQLLFFQVDYLHTFNVLQACSSYLITFIRTLRQD
jgi:hypothetical protein